MDIARPSQVRKRLWRRVALGAAGLLFVVLVTVGVSQLEPAAPVVDRTQVWIDAVERGPMLRQVRGAGTLVPEIIRWIPATTEGRVERIHVLPGTSVDRETVLLELSNPELELATLDAASELRAAEAALANLRVQLQTQHLSHEASAASVEAEYHQAELEAKANERLAVDGLIADITLELSRVRVRELGTRTEIEHRRLAIDEDAARAQLDVSQAAVDRARALSVLRLSQVDALRVRAGSAGILQQLRVEAGQRVDPGTNLARVSEPGSLKAEVRVSETQAPEVQIGQPAAIDTRNGIIEGRVSRIDPASENGTVTVDVALEGELPRGARPDLSVDGTIELERLDDVLHVGRPVFGEEQSTISLFKLERGGREAVRVQVKLGRGSVSTMEIAEGLHEGDQVILSDMSQWDGFDRVRLD
jgi:HlyD family secretion protein